MIVNPNVGGGKQETPIISVSSSGLITATVGDKSATKQLSTQGAKTVTPTDYEQTVVSAGKYTTGTVKVAAVAKTTPTYVNEITSATADYDAEPCTLTINVPGIQSGANIIGLSGYIEYSTKGMVSVTFEHNDDNGGTLWLRSADEGCGMYYYPYGGGGVEVNDDAITFEAVVGNTFLDPKSSSFDMKLYVAYINE